MREETAQVEYIGPFRESRTLFPLLEDTVYDPDIGRNKLIRVNWQVLDNGQIVSQPLPVAMAQKVTNNSSVYRIYNPDKAFNPKKDVLQVNLNVKAGSEEFLRQELARMKVEKERLERELITAKQMHGKYVEEEQRKESIKELEAERLRPKKRKS